MISEFRLGHKTRQNTCRDNARNQIASSICNDVISHLYSKSEKSRAPVKCSRLVEIIQVIVIRNRLIMNCRTQGTATTINPHRPDQTADRPAASAADVALFLAIAPKGRNTSVIARMSSYGRRNQGLVIATQDQRTPSQRCHLPRRAVSHQTVQTLYKTKSIFSEVKRKPCGECTVQ